MTTEQKFNAAVNVIRNLPKNGSYQPSNDLLLRFYSYFKQATEGPCKQSKPSFWDLVKKAKWDAWKRLGNMSKEEAMAAYVEELNKIVETMSYNDNVGNFMESLNTFYDNVPAEEIDLILGPVIERVRSQPGSPLSNSPLGGSPLLKSPYISRDPSPSRIQNGKIPNGGLPNGHIVSDNKEIAKLIENDKLKTIPNSDNLNNNIKNIQTDLNNILERIKRLEVLSKLLAVQNNGTTAKQSVFQIVVSMVKRNLPVISFVLFWPIFIQFFTLWINRRRQNALK